jgi:site-specific DNA recombinase
MEIKTRVILYPRVSSKRQLEQGDSIDAQINRMTKFCYDKGYEIVDIYTDGGKSASIKDDDLKQMVGDESFSNIYNLNVRPAFKRLLLEAQKKKFDAIVFFKWDRYSRDVAFAELSIRYFEKFGIRLIPTDDSEDLFVSSIMRAMSKAEIDKMKSRVKLGRESQFDKGIIVGRCPFGYKPLFKDKEHRRGILQIVPHKKQAEIVQDCFKMTSEGVGYREICKKHGLKPQSYYNIIKNKVYIGIITFEGIEKKGSHLPLISEELFNKINKKGGNLLI